MKFMLRVVLPIAYHTEDSDMKENLGLETTEEDFVYRDVMFYKINAVGDEVEDGVSTNRSIIYTGGEMFICRYSKERVDEIISACYK